MTADTGRWYCPKCGFVYSLNRYFWKCPKCGRVYWQGSHWRTINSIIDSVNRRLPSTY